MHVKWLDKLAELVETFSKSSVFIFQLNWVSVSVSNSVFRGEGFTQNGRLERYHNFLKRADKKWFSVQKMTLVSTMWPSWLYYQSTSFAQVYPQCKFKLHAIRGSSKNIRRGFLLIETCSLNNELHWDIVVFPIHR